MRVSVIVILIREILTWAAAACLSLLGRRLDFRRLTYPTRLRGGPQGQPEAISLVADGSDTVLWRGAVRTPFLLLQPNALIELFGWICVLASCRITGHPER